MSEREERFEKMLTYVRESYAKTCEKLDLLKAEDKTKSATFRQLMGDKMFYQNVLALYKIHGIIDE